MFSLTEKEIVNKLDSLANLLDATDVVSAPEKAYERADEAWSLFCQTERRGHEQGFLARWALCDAVDLLFRLRLQNEDTAAEEFKNMSLARAARMMQLRQSDDAAELRSRLQQQLSVASQPEIECQFRQLMDNICAQAKADPTPLLASPAWLRCYAKRQRLETAEALLRALRMQSLLTTVCDAFESSDYDDGQRRSALELCLRSLKCQQAADADTGWRTTVLDDKYVAVQTFRLAEQTARHTMVFCVQSGSQADQQELPDSLLQRIDNVRQQQHQLQAQWRKTRSF